ncbi:hypothetical protein Tco_0731756 [Tanacetum coccineum]
MDDPNITMEEYIRLEEEKAQKRRKVFNWETAKYGKICTVYTAYSLNEYGVYDTGINTVYPGEWIWRILGNGYGVSWGIDTAYRLHDLGSKEKSTNIDGEFTNMEILKCWSLETSRRFSKHVLKLQGGCSTQSCSINSTWRIYRANIRGVSHSNSF